MKPKEIKWEKHKECNDLCGMIDSDEVFTIKERNLKGKETKYALLSANIPNDVFYRSTQLKEIGIFNSIEDAKKDADKFWMNYIYKLIEE